MATGSDREDDDSKDLDAQGGGQSVGVPADGQLEGSSYNPLGNPGMKHWQASYIDRDGFDDRGNIFFAAVEMTRMPMVVTDPRQPDNPIVFVNRAFLDLTQFPEHEIIGRNCRFLQGPQTDPATVTEIRNAIADERAVALDILNYKADGTPFWNALYLGPIFDHEGQLLYFFDSQMDVTERRASEQSSLQAQKMEAIGQLTAGMAHDFNNLLQVINGNLELALLTLGTGNSTAGESIRRAQRSAMKAGKLTQQLLTFARKQRLEPRRVNLNALLVEFSELLVRTLGDKVELHLDLKPALPACVLDPTHLEMALLNVLINARDAMPDGGEVKVATALGPGNQVLICVTDGGEGMTPEVMRRATEPFFTTKGVGKGTGLGLSQVYGMAQQSGGAARILSEQGVGTTVEIWLRSAGSAADLPALVRPSVAATRQRGARILVVEDDAWVRQSVVESLEVLGYTVAQAADGEAGLGELQRSRPDLLITDYLMPGMTGAELVRQARGMYPKLPMMIATGYADMRLIEEVVGEDMVLNKPFQLAELAASVERALSKRN